MDGRALISRDEAQRQGLRRYFTGEPCKHGHIAERATANAACYNCACVREQRRRDSDPDLYRRYYAEKRTERAAANSVWHKANWDSIKARKAAWWAAHPEEMRLYARNRRAKLAASVDQHTPQDLHDIARAQGHRCAYCRTGITARTRQVDHIQPLKRGGSNGRRNLQFTCRPCNSAKRAKDPIDFAQQRGLLL